jgi:ferrochelatase
VRGVVRRVNVEVWELGYQSRTGPVRWLEPDVRQVIQRLGRSGARRVVVVPISFVSDHIETLHEIDIELRALAAGSGIDQLARAPALNENRSFIAALADIVLAAGS